MFKTFVEGEILTAEDVNDGLMRQVIARVTTTERDAIPSPVAGMVIYNSTVGAFQRHNGTKWVSGGAGAIAYGTGWAASTTRAPLTATKDALSGLVTLAGHARRTAALTATSAFQYIGSLPAGILAAGEYTAVAYTNGTLSVPSASVYVKVAAGLNGFQEVSVGAQTGTLAMAVGQEVGFCFSFPSGEPA